MLLVEQHARMAFRISQRAQALTTGTIALSGSSAERLADDRVKALYLGGELEGRRRVGKRPFACRSSAPVRPAARFQAHM